MLSDTEPRPCHALGTQPNACALAHYRRVVENHVYLSGPWAGWRLAGRDLVAPDRQRINPERLRGLLMRQAMEERLSKAKARRKANDLAGVIPLPARERFEGCA